MKKNRFSVAGGLMCLSALLLLSACGKVDYKMLKRGEGKMTPEMGDYIIGEMWITVGDSILMTNAGKPGPIIQVGEPEFKGDLQEGVRLLHEGDSARFNIKADSIRARGMQLPEIVKETLTYVIKVEQIVAEADFPAYLEAKMAEADMAQQEAIAAYLQENGLNVEPTSDGLYFIRTQAGKGKAIKQGSPVKFHYVGRLLDGTIFDTSIKEVAEENGLFHPMRNYEPLSTMAGTGQMILGMDEGLLMMRQGDKATLIIPFQLGYGDRDLGPIPAYSPLIFEMEIVSVEDPA
ncbi:MAG: FKBP-type peptidyl-prolyl cis-trans isomerase [Bacteroidales bacterium]|nr:FKBP-type peptidyl-prolyl cis-trans isomerase [Bacteroidales bacterium]